jgi:alpha-galactosidase
VERIITEGNYPAKVEVHLDRQNALKGADAVVCTILAGDVKVWRHDIEIPKKYGIDINIGDTRGPAGIFRALRTIPVMLDICRDIEQLCPQAILLNYTNPMAMLCRAMQRETEVLLTGLCHSVQGTADMLARWIGSPLDEFSYTCAGINHQAWYLELSRQGEDAYPILRKAVEEREEIYKEEIIRNEIFLHLGYYVTESSGHNSEYNWWFRKRPDLIERYCTHGTGWNPGVYAYILHEYLIREQTWQREIQNWLDTKEPLDLSRGDEYAAPIMNAYLGGEPYRFNGNVPNTQLITNLPDNACVEVPVYVDKEGLHSLHVGALPPQCAVLTNLNVAVEEMAVEGCLSGDPETVFRAIAHDPLTAAVLSLSEIRQMVKEMFRQNQDYLPTFKTIDLY